MATLDPGKHTVAFGAVNVTGFMDGTMIEAERAEDGWTIHVSGDGTLVTRMRNRNASGIVTLTLVETAASNELLSAIAKEDELLGTGVRTLSIKDTNSSTKYFAKEAWIQKIPKGEHAKEVTARVWLIACAKLDIDTGASQVA